MTHSQLELLSNRTGPRVPHRNQRVSALLRGTMVGATAKMARSPPESCVAAEGLMLSSVVGVVVLRHRRVYRDR